MAPTARARSTSTGSTRCSSAAASGSWGRWPRRAGAEREDEGVSLRTQVVEIVRERALMHLPEPVTLASGEKSQDFIDVKKGLQRGRDLEVACRAILEVIGDIEF